MTGANDDTRLPALARLLQVVDRLRAPDGCPWDRKQTVASVAPFLVEEAYEALEAIEQGDDGETAAELGDVLMVVTLICRIAEQEGRFDLGRSAASVAEKLVRRHPHVFGDVEADTANEVLRNWEAIKKEERAGEGKDDSALAGVPVALPALQRARRVCDKAVTAGFRWQDASGALAKVREELGELERELQARDGHGEGAGADADDAARVKERVEAELGDLLLATAFLGGYLDLDPEAACRAALRRFEQRFRAMEGDLDGPLAGHDLAELVRVWARAKERTA
jgi:MazG family protein